MQQKLLSTDDQSPVLRSTLANRNWADKIEESTRRGAIAQLGERIVRNDEVVGSIPTSSTIFSITCESCL